MHVSRERPPLATHRLAVVLSAWSLGYAAYRAYYAFGGQAGMIGTPISQSQLERTNAIGAAVIGAAGLLPLVAVRVRALGRTLPVLGWVGGVGCCMHAAVDMTLRVLSLTGVHPTELPSAFWASYDRRASDLQDLFLNEPWFLVTGLLWAALGAAYVHRDRRPAWAWSAAAVCAALTAVGVLSGLQVVGSFHLG
jgi:hypothetical protein